MLIRKKSCLQSEGFGGKGYVWTLKPEDNKGAGESTIATIFDG